MIEYRPAMELKFPVLDVGDNYVIANIKLIAIMVSKHFAARPIYKPHPSGADGLYLLEYSLDHIGSGMGIPSGVFGFTILACRALAKSLETVPVDWKSPPDHLDDYPTGFREWFVLARSSAVNGESIAWGQ